MANQDDEFNEGRNRRAAAHPRAVGSPLPRGSTRRPAFSESESEAAKAASAPPPGRALTTGAASGENTLAADGNDNQSGAQRAMNLLRMAVPLVQRLLPILDGNIVAAVTNVLTQHPQKPAPTVDLAPLRESVSGLDLRHRELRDQVIEQNASLKKVEDQLEMVREATDRNTLEQQELMEDLRSVGHKVNVVAVVALVLLAVSVVLNLLLYLHMKQVLP